MADTLRGNIRQFARDYIREHGRCDPDEVLDAIYERFGDDIRSNWERETREYWRRLLKDDFKRDEEDDDTVVMQTALPGFSWPNVINVQREGGGVTWVDGLAATKDDVRSQQLLKNMNIINATRQRDVFDRKVDRLEPAWAVNPDWTVGECIEYLAQKEVA